MNSENFIKLLAAADPDLADMVSTGLKKKKRTFSSKNIKLLVDETLWAMSSEISFGNAIAESYINLIGNINQDGLFQYRDLTRKAGKIGPTFGRVMAIHLVPVLKHGDGRILKMFLGAVDIMMRKGAYTLKDPLKSLAILLTTGDKQSTVQYLKLLSTAFSNDMTYSQSQHFSYVLPKTVLSFSSSKRPWQIIELNRLVDEDFRLVDPFLDGMEKGLYLLSKEALGNFISFALEKVRQNLKFGIKFLSLTSKLGIDTCEGMQVTVPLTQVAHQIDHYLRARTGVTIPIRPLSMLPKAYGVERGNNPVTCCDGKYIYLPDEINFFKKKEENIKLYKCLARFESGYFEFHTFDFDLEKAIEKSPGFCPGSKWKPLQEKMSDLQGFFRLFPQKKLASDLFTIFEHGRIRTLLARRYPGLVRKFLPMLCKEATRIFKAETCFKPIYLLYLRVALGSVADGNLNASEEYIKKIACQFEKKIIEDHTVEACAHLVICAYPEIEAIIKQNSCDKITEPYQPIKFPFGRQLRPDLYYLANNEFENIAQTVKARIEAKGFRVYKSEIRKHLEENSGVFNSRRCGRYDRNW